MLLAAYWFQGWYTNFTAGVFIMEKTKLLPGITSAGAGVTIIANSILIPQYGMEGAAWASVLSYGAMAMMIYRASQKEYAIPYNMAAALLIMAVCGSTVAATAWIPWLSSFVGKMSLLAGGTSIVAAITFVSRRG
jgi:O-antigen/teichoic acid export membrane protein